MLSLALVVLPLVEGMLLVTTSSCNTVLQTVLPEEPRGRVMALCSTAFLGTAPPGSLLAGAWVARVLPSLRAAVRPVYVERGLIPANEVPASVAR